MKKIRNIAVALLPLVLFSGCFKHQVKCDDESVLGLVKDGTYDYVKNATLVNMTTQLNAQENNNQTTSMFANMYVEPSSVIGQMILSGGYGEKSPFAKNLEFAKDYFKNAKYLIEDIRTVEQNKELNKVTCKSVVKFFTLDKEDGSKVGFDFDLDYNAQISDTNEKVFVDIVSISVH